jgi:hypothetical protein
MADWLRDTKLIFERSEQMAKNDVLCSIRDALKIDDATIDADLQPRWPRGGSIHD